ncbi:MAG TPA: (d)CMP kinase [Herpetosiphonaceae bacterium]|nr:(d)CMP kinase [Herpetosiphonaceae bacterium]
MRLPTVITIDGPAASGKSTLGELLARRLGYIYFDTGVLYRALALLALRREIELDDAEALANLARQVVLEVLPPTVDDGRQNTVLADGEDLTPHLRDVEVERAVSRVAGYPAVRAALRDQQRAIGLRGKVVMVGRDIGSVVMPDAEYKLFLDAPIEERARRRQADLARRGTEMALSAVAEDLERRDEQDRRNTFVPEGAIILRNEKMTPDEEVDYILDAFGQDLAIGEASVGGIASPTPGR